MTGDQAAQLTGAVMMLVLVGSSLMTRQLSLGQTARMVAGWLLIFAIVLVGYTYREELRSVGQRVTGELTNDGGQTVGSVYRVPMAPDGHFWVRAEINGHTQRFLIDSGATTTGLTDAAAAADDVKVDDGFPVMIDTANGTIAAHKAEIDTLTLGPITARHLAAMVSPAGDTNVLGMNFLSSLKAWRVEGRSLVLVPHQAKAPSRD